MVASRDRKGMVTMTCGSPDAKITYKVDGGEAKPYAGPFELKQAGKLDIQAAGAGLPAASVAEFPAYNPRWAWTISCDSFQKNEGEAEHAFDGDPQSYWHTQWKPKEDKFPHFVAVNFGQPLKLQGITYWARAGKDGQKGRVKEYEIYVSDDGKKWGKPVAGGQVENREGEQKILFAQPVTARHLKFVAKSEIRNNPFAAVAEIELIEAK